ncbi:MAG: chemotaxis protein CheA [Candidatus Nitrosotalea sp.]|nr:chemotaxis protein CheA [Candidatus Nitrosotalea sp.]
MSENSKYRELFVQEALEHVENLSQNLLKYEEDPNSKELVDNLFRSAHSLKGMAATMDYNQILEICKSIEEIFDRFRQNEEKITVETGNVLFYGIDLIKQLVQDEKKTIDLQEFLNYLKDPNSFQVDIELRSVSQKTSPIVRVRMDNLDAIMNLVGEMMISKIRLEQNVHLHMSDETREIVTNLGSLITELQHKMMHIRLVPIDQMFNRFSRMIRDISSSLGKEIKLEMNGSGIELDRSVLDAIGDPLLHMLRNSVDHGIETPDVRKAVGKPEVGTIRLRAIRKGNKVEIQVTDDGRGMDLESIKSKAIEKNIVTQDQVEKMSDEDVICLIGTPGLSTAKEVTEISGRGVGMDVVMTQVRNFGGHVKILTEKGMGTTIILTMPLSLAIIGGLVANIGDQKFILPLSSIFTTLTIDRNEILYAHGKEMVKLGDQIIPILRTSAILGINPVIETSENDQVHIVVVEKNEKYYGLIVDSLEKEQEIVVKKIDNSFGGSDAFTDASILSDGRVALILEPSILI